MSPTSSYPLFPEATYEAEFCFTQEDVKTRFHSCPLPYFDNLLSILPLRFASAVDILFPYSHAKKITQHQHFPSIPQETTRSQNTQIEVKNINKSEKGETGSRVLTVAQDGCGDFKTVQEAIDAVPFCNTCRTVIRVSPGVYKQPVYVPKTKNLITLAGLRPEITLLTWHNTASSIQHHQASRVIGTGTFGCGSAIVEGEDFIAENITFENSSPKGSGQAVAIRVTADRCAFYNCRFLGWQDTLYLHYGKQYLKDCYIEGSVDFIFGNSTALLEHCHIHCKSAGFITAQSRKSSQETTGYVFLRCVITGNGETSYTYLGRPWGPFGRVVYAYTFMDACIKHVGWDNWGKTENERSACFYEYRCFGPGSCPSKRVNWARELLEEEAEQFLMHTFIDPNPERPWLAQRMALRIPYSA